MKFSYAEEYFFPVVMKDIKVFDFSEDAIEVEALRKNKDEDFYNELFKEVDDEFINEILCNNI